MDIAAWLRGLGLERYEQAFHDNEIDGAILPKLTSDDLREIGVTAIGHRRKLLEAIGALTENEPPLAPQAQFDAPRDTARQTDVSHSTKASPQPMAERRQLTVMFVDLVGSTALAGQLDPEDMGALIRAYQNAVAGEIMRFEGHIAKYMGDGVLAYFGWPQAHEDEAERAVRAGLAVVKAVSALDAPGLTLGGGRVEQQPLAARVGIATGLVMVGELIGEGTAQEQSVVGETPNLAARLQALAEPGSVVISQATRRLLGGLFEGEDLGPQRLKGFAEPLTAWRVACEGRAEGRFEALHGAHLTPLIGRAHELGILLERWAWAKEGDGQVVLLSGEPGIGKSRLIQALRERLGGEPYTPLSHYCSPYHTNSALYPVTGLLERATGLDRGAAPAAQLARLEAVLACSSKRLSEVLPLLAALLGVPIGERYPPLNLTPEAQKRRTQEALVDQLGGLAARQPVLALYEDAHWIDPTTLELLDLVIERVRRLPVLVVITYRPEFIPPWHGQAHVTALPLNRLGRRQGAAIVERVTSGKPLPDEVLDQILAKTDGVPLFVEELTKTVLESDLLADKGDHYELSGPLPPLAIPATLHDSLMARLDRLAPVKEVVQIGAVIGREFSHGLLGAVADRPEAQLRATLDQLVASELIFRRGVPPEATYSFKHALVQDAAYQSLLKSKRERLHARVVQVLEERFPDTADAQPEQLAYHCLEAGLLEKAVDYHYQAGQRAIGRSAMAEAVAQLQRGLGALTSLPKGPRRRQQELDLQIALGSALISMKGYAAEETGRAFARARHLGEQVGDVRRLMPVLNGQMLFQIERTRYLSACEIATRMLELAQGDGQGKPALLIPAHRALSLACYELRRFAAARKHADRVLELYEPDRHRALASLYGFDQRTVALGYLAAALFILGYPDQAQQRSEQQLGEARKLGHPNTLAQALSRASIFSRMTRNSEGLREAADALVELAAEHGLPYFEAIGKLHRGRVLIERGRVKDGMAEIQRAAAAARLARARWSPAHVSCMTAEAYALAGRHHEAATWAAEALSRWNEVQSSWFAGDQLWHKGQLLLWLAEPHRDEAEASFRRAVEVARAQEARMWELRAATSLARLWAGRGRRVEAHDLLAPVYGWFTEGFATADLKDAKALLDELC